MQNTMLFANPQSAKMRARRKTTLTEHTSYTTLNVKDVWNHAKHVHGSIIARCSWLRLRSCVSTDGGVSLVARVRISRRLRLYTNVACAITYDEDARRLTLRVDAPQATYTSVFAVTCDAQLGTRIEHNSTLACRGALMQLLGSKHARLVSELTNAVDDAVSIGQRFAKFQRAMRAFWHNIPRVLANIGSSEVRNHFDLVLVKNCQGGKMFRSFITWSTLDLLLRGNLTAVRTREALGLCWRMEVFQAFVLVEDDIMDNSPERRNAPSWWAQVGVPVALNDGLMLYVACHRLLAEYAGDDVRQRLAYLLDESALRTVGGQFLDLKMTRADSGTNTTLRDYNEMVRMKTGYYSFFEPMALAIVLARQGRREEEALLRDALTVSLHLGELYQWRDDYNDCFNERGKKGMDIVDGKCTWLFIEARRMANDVQRQILCDNYGVKSDGAEAAVKQLYEELGLRSTYETYERDALRRIRKLASSARPVIQAVVNDIIAACFAT